MTQTCISLSGFQRGNHPRLLGFFQRRLLQRAGGQAKRNLPVGLGHLHAVVPALPLVRGTRAGQGRQRPARQGEVQIGVQQQFALPDLQVAAGQGESGSARFLLLSGRRWSPLALFAWNPVCWQPLCLACRVRTLRCTATACSVTSLTCHSLDILTLTPFPPLR